MDSSSDAGSEGALLNHASSLGGVLRHRRPSMADQGGMRERSPSQTTVETMYSRAGKELSRFEFSNPALPDSAHHHSRPRAPSQAEQHLDAQRIDNLLHSSAKFDSAVLMERRTRRATSVIARPYEPHAVVVGATHEEEEQNE